MVEVCRTIVETGSELTKVVILIFKMNKLKFLSHPVLYFVLHVLFQYTSPHVCLLFLYKLNPLFSYSCSEISL